MKFTCPRTCPLAQERWCRFRPVLDLLGAVKVDSHTATLKCDYRDPQALQRAVEGMGGLWYGQGHFDLGDTDQDGWGFRLPMEKGYHRERDGRTYWFHPLVVRADGEIAFDDYGGCWGNREHLKTLESAYAVEVVQSAAQGLGWLCERTQEGGLLVYHPQGGTLALSPGGKLDLNGFVGSSCHDALLALNLPLEDIQAKPVNSAVQSMCQIPS